MDRASEAAAQYDEGKAPTNLTVRADLVRRARKLKLNLSQIFEDALEEVLRRHEREEWLAENGEAISGYNQRVKKRGLFSDGRRRF
jgi:antitoxin CcdA